MCYFNYFAYDKALRYFLNFESLFFRANRRVSLKPKIYLILKIKKDFFHITGYLQQSKQYYLKILLQGFHFNLAKDSMGSCSENRERTFW